ncbi:MAG: hypothetical protein ACRD3T_20520, partial [Terriglobia bacterium]
NDFTPRPVFYAMENTIALFSDTYIDPSIEAKVSDDSKLPADEPVLTYGFRSRSGKAIVAYWAAVYSKPGNVFHSQEVTLTLEKTGIEHPVLIDITSGRITSLHWKNGTTGSLGPLPLKDSVMAIADGDYFDWPALPETPHSLHATSAGHSIRLSWELPGGNRAHVAVERRRGNQGPWARIATLPSSATQYVDSGSDAGASICYRVRALNSAGESAYSNIVSVKL